MSGVVLPWPPKELTPNFKRRKHWSAYRDHIRVYRLECWALARQAKLKVASKDAPLELSITFHPPDRRRRDDDGMIGAFKAGRDGLAEALGMDDHLFRPTYRVGEPVERGRVVVVLV